MFSCVLLCIFIVAVWLQYVVLRLRHVILVYVFLCLKAIAAAALLEIEGGGYDNTTIGGYHRRRQIRQERQYI